MNLGNIRKGELSEVFNALEEAFNVTSIDYYLIGALARDVWYAQRSKTMRQTNDADFAVLVGSESAYHSVKQYLKENKNFQDTRENSFVMLAPSGIQVDILPFGAVEIDTGIKLASQGLTNIHVNGFMEVYQAGTKEIRVETGHNFKVATLPSIVLLKFIAFDDRPEHRTKDAIDVANIISHFFDLQADLIYSEHADLFEKEERTFEEISAIVIGREMKKICASNEKLFARLSRILKMHIEQKEKSAFVRNMLAGSEDTVETKVRLLQNIYLSLGS